MVLGGWICLMVYCILQMESAVSAPVSGHVKRVAVHEGKYYLMFTVIHL